MMTHVSCYQARSLIPSLEGRFSDEELGRQIHQTYHGVTIVWWVPIIGRNVAVPAPLSCPALYATFSSQRSPPPLSWIWLQNFTKSNPDPTVPGQKTFKQRNLFMKLDSAFSVQDNDIFKNGGGGGSQRFSPAS